MERKEFLKERERGGISQEFHGNFSSSQVFSSGILDLLLGLGIY
jgi:hypothetical protein